MILYYGNSNVKTIYCDERCRVLWLCSVLLIDIWECAVDVDGEGDEGNTQWLVEDRLLRGRCFAWNNTCCVFFTDFQRQEVLIRSCEDCGWVSGFVTVPEIEYGVWSMNEEVLVAFIQQT